MLACLLASPGPAAALAGVSPGRPRAGGPASVRWQAGKPAASAPPRRPRQPLGWPAQFSSGPPTSRPWTPKGSDAPRRLIDSSSPSCTLNQNDSPLDAVEPVNCGRSGRRMGYLCPILAGASRLKAVDPKGLRYHARNDDSSSPSCTLDQKGSLPDAPRRLIDSSSPSCTLNQNDSLLDDVDPSFVGGLCRHRNQQFLLEI